MELNVKLPTTINATHVHVHAAVRYGEEDIPNDFPMREGDMWRATIELDTGVIVCWPAGRTGSMHMKVCDEGIYKLIASDGRCIATHDGYVPGFFPGDHYGDYLILDIDGDGKIAGWKATPDRVEGAFFGE